MSIIETQNLCYTYDDGTKALHDVCIKIASGKTTAILGGNGAGKSTLFLNMNAVLTPTTGKVLYEGQEVNYNRKNILEMRKNIGLVFQDPDDQLFSASVRSDISFGVSNIGLPRDEISARVEEAMKQTGVDGFADKPVHALSFGQKKRVAIAGVLVMKPKVIILDEPTAGLDPNGVSELMHLLLKIKNENGVAIVIATHDIDLIPIYCDYAYILNSGKVTLEGTPEGLFAQPDLLRQNNLRLTRIAHLMEILRSKDNIEFENNATTISQARIELLKVIKGDVTFEN